MVVQNNSSLPLETITEELRYVPTETIRKKISPLCKLSKKEITAIIQKYDIDNVGGLSEPQWKKFCNENRHIISILGVEMIDYDQSGEYTLVTVQRRVEYAHKPHGLAQLIIQFLDGFVAGGVAGAISKTVIAPGDRVKIIFQVDSRRPFSLREAVRLGIRTVREYGLTGLWIGNGATMLRVVPYAAITYLSFDFYQSRVNELLKQWFSVACDEKHDVFVRFFCGALAGATSTTCTYPLDLMRARFAANSTDKKKRFPSYHVAFRRATEREGIRSLYSGLFPTLVGIMPYAGCSFACFETIKKKLVQHYDYTGDKDIPALQRLMAGGFSGLVAQSVTYPLDIVRRRMQVTPNRYPSVGAALRTIYREEGFKQGLFKGLSMNWIKGPIAVATSFTVNDLIKSRTREYHSTAAAPSKNGVTLSEAFLCGGVAAGVAKLWTLPIDNLKIMYQLGISEKIAVGERVFTPRERLCHVKDLIVRNPNMWSSGNIMMMRVVPYGALTYSFFDVSQCVAERVTYSHEPTVFTNFVGGAAAAAAGTFLVYPLDLIRTRSAAKIIPKFQSYFWLMFAMSRRHGVASLWEGCYVSTVGVGLLAGIGFASYEYLKRTFQLESFSSRLAAGTAAGVLGQTLTWPMKIIKIKRQTEMLEYTNVALSFSHNKKMGPQFLASFYARMPFSWTVNSLVFGISFALNDAFRELMVNARQKILHGLVFS